MAFDFLLKQILKKISTKKAVSGYSIGTQEMMIDIVFKPEKSDVELRYLPSFFSKKGKHFVIEYKSHHDRYNESDFSKTALYKWGYCYNEKFSIQGCNDVYGCLMVVERLKIIDTLIKTGVLEKTEEKGLYQLKDNIIDYFIIINEFEVNEKNLGLLINSSGKKLKMVLKFIYENGYHLKPDLKNYIYSKCFLLDREVDDEFMTETKKILNDSHAESIKWAVNVIGIKKVIESIGLEKVIESIGLEKLEEMIEKYKITKKIKNN